MRRRGLGVLMSTLLVYLTRRPRLSLVGGTVLVRGQLLGAADRDATGCAGAGRGTHALWPAAFGVGTERWTLRKRSMSSSGRRTLSWEATGGWTAGVRDCGGTVRSAHSGGARREVEAG